MTGLMPYFYLKEEAIFESGFKWNDFFWNIVNKKLIVDILKFKWNYFLLIF